MAELESLPFGKLEYDERTLVDFPAGLPAFENERRFLPFERPSAKPFLFLQSLTRPDLIFVTLPVELADPAYRLELTSEDLATLGLPAGSRPQPGTELLVLVLVTLPEEGPASVNLMSPIVIYLAHRRAVQVIQVDTDYPHQHPLTGSVAEASCL